MSATTVLESRETIRQAGEVRSVRLESLRAVAALGVLVGHVFGTAYGYGPAAAATYPRRVVYGGGFGVFLFFALSGYLLFWPFARRVWAGGARLDLQRYAVNRALRILPLYYVMVVVLLLVQEHGGSSTQWLRFLTWTECFSSATFDTVNGVVWSLVVELMFYALLPLLAWLLAWRAGSSPWRAAVRLVGLGLLSLLFRFWVTKWSSAPLPWRYSLPATFLFFVPGMLVALLRCRWSEPRVGAPWRLALYSEAWILVAVALWLITCIDYDLLPLLALSSGLMVGGCVLPLRRGLSVRALEWRWLAAVGVASYSLYLWHVPVIRLITGAGVPGYGAAGLLVRVLPLALAVALLSYGLIESPFLRLRRRWSEP